MSANSPSLILEESESLFQLSVLDLKIIGLHFELGELFPEQLGGLSRCQVIEVQSFY